MSPDGVYTPRLVKTTLLIGLLALALAAVACGGDEAAETTTTTLATLPPVETTSSSSTTTTTTSPPALSPLNGAPVEDGELLDRRVMGIKIDNHPNGRPQSGLLDSDLVIEEEAEGGITRFIALFLQSDSEDLGPMRSVRPTDIGFLGPLGATIGYSGGQDWIKNAVAAAGIPAIGETRENDATWRMSERSAPHNLYVNTLRMRELADDRDYPDDPPEQPFLPFGDPPAGLATPASQIRIDWAFGNHVEWVWDEDEGLWLRSQQGSPHGWIDAEGEERQIAVETLLVLDAPDYVAQPSGGGSAVPATETTGTGRALLFHDGTVIEGTWTRETVEDPFDLEVGGRPLLVPAGEIWLTMHPDDDPVSWE